MSELRTIQLCVTHWSVATLNDEGCESSRLVPEPEPFAKGCNIRRVVVSGFRELVDPDNLDYEAIAFAIVDSLGDRLKNMRSRVKVARDIIPVLRNAIRGRPHDEMI